MNWKFLENAATVLAILGVGIGLGTVLSSGKKESLEEGNKDLKSQVERLEADTLSQKTKEGNLLAELYKCQSSPIFISSTPNQPEAPKKEVKGPSITVAKGETGEIQGEMSISVQSLSIAYDPFRYVVAASVGAPGKKSLQPPLLSIGEHINFGMYDIQLLSADLTKARFGIRKVTR